MKALHYDGSGQRVPLPGKYFLEIRLSPAAAHNESGQSVYKGPRLVRISLPALKGVALTGDFEGVVTVGAAFSAKPFYKTFTLHSPSASCSTSPTRRPSAAAERTPPVRRRPVRPGPAAVPSRTPGRAGTVQDASAASR
ncbi:hypothetical protein AB6O49_33070 [Streptomyces sp. SBR177]